MNTWPLVYVITLNWNRCDDTLRFLAFSSQLDYAHYRILVVDNGSTDNSITAISAHFPDVEQVVNGCNLGFAAGMNVGIRYAMARGVDFVFLANNDTLVAPDTLSLLVEAILVSGASLAAPAILYTNAPQCIWSAGGWHNNVTLEITGCRRGQRAAALGHNPFEVDFVTACGMLIRRRCLEEVGLFDERFAMYYEDMDYCLRARTAGHCVQVVPQAKMLHDVAASIGGSNSPGERYHMALSSVLFFRKHVKGWRWFIVVPYRIGCAVKTVIRLLVAGKPRSADAYLHGLQDGVAM